MKIQAGAAVGVIVLALSIALFHGVVGQVKSPNSLASGGVAAGQAAVADDSETDIGNTLQMARSWVKAGTQAGEFHGAMSENKPPKNYDEAIVRYQEASNALAIHEAQGRTNVALKAQLLGEYGWLLRATDKDRKAGEKMVFDALKLEPGSANLNTKAGLILLSRHTSTDTDSVQTNSTEQARTYFLNAVRLDPDYGYAYFALSQVSYRSNNVVLPDKQTDDEYVRKFIALSDRVDLELLLYDQRKLDDFVQVMREALKKNASPSVK